MPELLAWALSNMGASFRQRGELRAALAHLREAADVYRCRPGHEHQEANNYRRMAYALSDSGEYDKAVDSADRAMKIYSAAGDSEGVARCWLAVARVSYDCQKFAEACVQFAAALPHLGPGVFLDYTLHNVRACFVRADQAGQRIENLPDLKDALRLARSSGRSGPPAQRNSFGNNQPTVEDAKTRWLIGLVLEKDRQYRSAAHFISGGIEELARHDARLDIAEAGLDLCRIYVRLGRPRTANRIARETVEIVGDEKPGALIAFETWQSAVRQKDLDRMRELAIPCRESLT